MLTRSSGQTLAQPARAAWRRIGSVELEDEADEGGPGRTMSTLERFQYLMGALDAGHRDLLANRARRLLDVLRPADNQVRDGQEHAARAAASLEQLMDLVEAHWTLARDFAVLEAVPGSATSRVDLATRFFEEMESCISKTNRRSHLLPSESVFRSNTVLRLHRLLAGTEGAELEPIVDGLRRTLGGWRSQWTVIEPDRRTVGMWRLLIDLTARLDALDTFAAEARSREADPVDGNIQQSATGVTTEQAAEIAVRFRGAAPAGVPDDWWQPIKVTQDAPAGLYQTWPEEPAWYVWFLPRFVGLGSSEIIVVSKRSGEVIGGGSAMDEG